MYSTRSNANSTKIRKIVEEQMLKFKLVASLVRKPNITPTYGCRIQNNKTPCKIFEIMPLIRRIFVIYNPNCGPFHIQPPVLKIVRCVKLLTLHVSRMIYSYKLEEKRSLDETYNNPPVLYDKANRHHPRDKNKKPILLTGKLTYSGGESFRI